jgi:hypothetical protein
MHNNINIINIFLFYRFHRDHEIVRISSLDICKHHHQCYRNHLLNHTTFLLKHIRTDGEFPKTQFWISCWYSILDGEAVSHLLFLIASTIIMLLITTFIRYDPDTTISDRVEFENERVEFLTGIANLMMIKARLKLNTKKIYASDGRAVQELLKLATLLYKYVLFHYYRNHYNFHSILYMSHIKSHHIEQLRLLPRSMKRKYPLIRSRYKMWRQLEY